MTTDLHLATDADLPTTEQQTFTAAEMRAHTGCTQFQLSVWSTLGYIGTGQPDQYHRGDFDLVHAVIALIDLGFAVDRAMAMALDLIVAGGTYTADGPYRLQITRTTPPLTPADEATTPEEHT